ncbi:unnamed protein product [Rhizophagus irregularis]|nr:unnamed protein product [Rhizophagus irregularis]
MPLIIVMISKELAFFRIDTFSSRVFVHDYPNSSKIEAHYQSNGKLYNSYYNIISWKEGRAEWSVNSTKSSTAVANTFLQKIGQKHSTKLSGPRLFGLDIEPLYNFLDDHEVGNGAFRSLLTLLKALIPIWKAGENPVIIPGNTLYIKLGGDGRNVGRKQNHVMITFCLLNEGKEVLKPDHQYCICLYVGCEKYEDLAKVGQLFQNQLFDLKNNGIIDQDATSRWDMNRTWNNTVNTKCERKSPLFPAINQENYIPDELHLLLFTYIRYKKIMLEKFPVSQFIPDQEIDQFEIDAQNWICIFCHPTQEKKITIRFVYFLEDSFVSVRQKKGDMVGYNFVIAAFISLRVKNLFLEEKF